MATKANQAIEVVAAGIIKVPIEGSILITAGEEVITKIYNGHLHPRAHQPDLQHKIFNPVQQIRCNHFRHLYKRRKMMDHQRNKTLFDRPRNYRWRIKETILVLQDPNMVMSIRAHQAPNSALHSSRKHLHRDPLRPQQILPNPKGLFNPRVDLLLSIPKVNSTIEEMTDSDLLEVLQTGGSKMIEGFLPIDNHTQTEDLIDLVHRLRRNSRRKSSRDLYYPPSSSNLSQYTTESPEMSPSSGQAPMERSSKPFTSIPRIRSHSKRSGWRLNEMGFLSRPFEKFGCCSICDINMLLRYKKSWWKETNVSWCLSTCPTT